MATTAHSLVSLAAKHPIHKWEYANAAARTGATGFVSTDLHTVAFQSDNGTYWLLTATTPTWVQMIVGTSFGDLTVSGDLTLSGVSSKYVHEANTQTSGNMMSLKSTPGSASTATILKIEAAGANWATGSRCINIVANDADAIPIVINDGGGDKLILLRNGFIQTEGNLNFLNGGNIISTANGDVSIVPNGSGIFKCGSGTPGHLTPTSGEAYFQGKVEFDSDAYFDAPIRTSDSIIIASNKLIYAGAAGAGFISYNTSQTNASGILTTGTASNTVLFCEYGDATYNFAHASQTNPTLFGHSANQSTTEWWSLTHDQTDFVLNQGKGSTKLAGSVKYNVTTVNAATYDLQSDDHILHVTYTATAAVTSLTLMTAETVAGRKIVIKDAAGNATTNNITIDTEGSETIDGSATLVLNADYESVTLYSDGSDWFVIG